MQPVLRRILCLLSTLIVLASIVCLGFAQESDYIAVHTRPRTVGTPMVQPTFGTELIRPPFAYGWAAESALRLESAIVQKIGSPYRSYGTDDRGYDCSGFVWKAFHDAGHSFDRMSARSLWQSLPEITPPELRQFGTLVFFNDLTHVGIVRDAFSFYHSSRSQGVVLSFFAGYWENRISGYRRAPFFGTKVSDRVTDDSNVPAIDHR